MDINNNYFIGPFERDDKAALIRYLNDEELFNNTLFIPFPYTETDADNWLNMVEKEEKESGRRLNWSIRSREFGLVGGIGIMERTGPEGHRLEIGYWLAAPLRGQGLMTETVRIFCAWLFESRPNLVRIEAHVAPHNPASARVLEKAGFEKEGYAKKYSIKQGKHRDIVMFALVR